jgi:hypothetical protein
MTEYQKIFATFLTIGLLLVSALFITTVLYTKDYNEFERGCNTRGGVVLHMHQGYVCMRRENLMGRLP